MLKSLSTQFAATLFFGPLGLAYSSMAAAVFLTLILAVLYFTGLGVLALVLVWPASIIAGLVFVKLHNDQIRSSGSTLLLGPGEEEGLVSTFGSWGRGLAVLSIMGVIGYLAFWYFPNKQQANEYASERFVNSATTDSALVGSVSSDTSVARMLTGGGRGDSDQYNSEQDSFGQTSSRSTTAGGVSELAIAKTYPMETSSDQSADSFAVVALDNDEVQSVIIGTSSEAPAASNADPLYVTSEMVNLRQGPGTNFAILTQAQRGDELAEIDRAGSWIQVRTVNSNATGWIYSRLVSTTPE